MTDQQNEGSGYRGPALFSYGFRPFFLGAALFAGVAVPVWILMLAGVSDPALLFPARDWHVHEMVFGFLPAVITGFLLTAIPNWTDRPPIRGLELMLLFTVWLAGRVVIAVTWFSPLLAAIVDASFLVAVAGFVWRELAAGKSWSQAPIGGVISLYAGANIFFHVLVVSGAATDLPERMAIALVMVLVSLIGGRVIPNFTGEFLAQQGRTEQPAPFSRFDGLSLLLVGMAVTAWTVQPQAPTTGWLLVMAGLASLGRLSRWYGWMTWREPLVLVLHLGYGWLVLALLVLGSSIIGIGLPPTDAVHAFTAGAVGVMTLGVMTRASLGHTGRARHAGPFTVLMYALVTVGALLRVVGPTTGLPANLMLGLAAACWSGGYLLFALVYGPFLLRPALDE
ncbi:NnrS family protein [Nitrospira sp. NS4]|uniref:NnrS family protein n=1 Tax=Nitrospira sp. NS4 TaxID=3414498 RepID=UPI003C2B08FC